MHSEKVVISSSSFLHKQASIASGALLAILFGCCPRENIRRAQDLSPLRVSIAPTQSSVRIRHLRYIRSAPSGLSKETEQPLIEQEMERVKTRLSDNFAAKVSSSAILAVAPLDAEAGIFLTVEAYGRVPGKWLFYLVGSGVVEAAVQGIIVEKATGNQWLALGVSAEELASESLTWIGGSFVTNRFLTPIVLSCRIERLSDHKTIWSKHIVSLYSRKIIARLPANQRQQREMQLAGVSDHALSELLNAIEKSSEKIRRRLAAH